MTNSAGKILKGKLVQQAVNLDAPIRSPRQFLEVLVTRKISDLAGKFHPSRIARYHGRASWALGALVDYLSRPSTRGIRISLGLLCLAGSLLPKKALEAVQIICG